MVDAAATYVLSDAESVAWGLRMRVWRGKESGLGCRGGVGCWAVE